jgi:hypothetical protein
VAGPGEFDRALTLNQLPSVGAGFSEVLALGA